SDSRRSIQQCPTAFAIDKISDGKYDESIFRNTEPPPPTFAIEFGSQCPIDLHGVDARIRDLNASGKLGRIVIRKIPLSVLVRAEYVKGRKHCDLPAPALP